MITIAVLVLFNPTTEEVIFRGLLVHQFELIGAPLWFSLLVGAVVNAVTHASRS